MPFFLAVFSSLNQVALIKRRLYDEGIYAEMQRTPQCLSTTGCSYALRCDEQHRARFSQLCAAADLAPGGLFDEATVAAASGGTIDLTKDLSGGTGAVGWDEDEP